MQTTSLFVFLSLLWLSAACEAGPSPNPANPASTIAPVADADTIEPVDTMAAMATDDDMKLEEAEDAVKDAKSVGAPGRPETVAPPPGARPAPANPEFTDVTTLDPTIQLDIRYATRNNFTKKQIYDCPRCLLRPAVAQALVKAHRALRAKGYGGLKMFDCYRPRPYQQRLWDAVPDPNYVTPPAKGSMHSRGAAVDLTVIGADGRELDMGTPYDFFGREAHTDYTKLPAGVLANRKLLADALRAAGFEGIRTEWWHFSYRGKQYPLSTYVWDCR